MLVRRTDGVGGEKKTYTKKNNYNKNLYRRTFLTPGASSSSKETAAASASGYQLRLDRERNGGGCRPPRLWCTR